MADLGMTMKIKSAEYRPCLVGCTKALFHRWIDADTAIIERCGRGSSTKMSTIRTFYGLVEYEDGTIHKVNPEQIVFMDSNLKFKENEGWWD